MEETNTNIPLYESLSEDEGDMHDKDQEEPKFNIILAIAVVFDPCYKTHFVEFCYKMLYGEYNEQYPSLVETLKQIFNVYKNRIPTYSVEFDALDMELNPTLEKIELDRYLEEKRLNRITDIDILEYWNSNQFRFPNLALMAQDILLIHISNVASESAFSTGGRIMDQYRSCLAHAVVKSLICTRDWRFNEKEGISQRKTRGKYLPEILKVSIVSVVMEFGSICSVSYFAKNKLMLYIFFCKNFLVEIYLCFNMFL
ncbi:hypothetical protein POM88_043499 [Heracleum sosnowskyi]|uniref:HAT C-terminal dimerisation domain-containing protein n=1 Tax=Heracleum sosnowskyi TaxID=360622 RepID=A0AAD8M231_9APIA|nr:hypothetical protein POM88_043499 [Heracleum sosnowskyi]